MSCPVNMVSFFTLNSINSVNSRTYHVEQPSFDPVPYRHSDGRSCIGHFHAPNQAVGRNHRDGPYAIFSAMMLTFLYPYFAVWFGHRDGIIDFVKLSFFCRTAYVHFRADDLNTLSNVCPVVSSILWLK